MNKDTPSMAAITDEQYHRITSGMVPITTALCFALGWQGGTIHQVAAALEVSTQDILNADATLQGELLRKAQAVYWKGHQKDINMLMFKHFRKCVEALKQDHIGHYVPSWLERADGVLRILAETYGS